VRAAARTNAHPHILAIAGFALALAGAAVVAPTAADLAAGAEVYDGACARCHGKIGGGRSALGAAFHPPAPQLPGHRTAFTEAELVYLITHGIRMSGMPAWGGLLSERDIARVAAVVARFPE
jgi:mono/diheme cytochrome c family protein